MSDGLKCDCVTYREQVLKWPTALGRHTFAPGVVEATLTVRMRCRRFAPRHYPYRSFAKALGNPRGFRALGARHRRADPERAAACERSLVIVTGITHAEPRMVRRSRLSIRGYRIVKK